jgi:hypothetical protein
MISERYGITEDAEPVVACTLANAAGVQVRLLSLGCIIPGMLTDAPGLQLYAASRLNGALVGPAGRVHWHVDGLRAAAAAIAAP